MGYRVLRKKARLSFEGEEYEGLVIEAAMDLTFEAQEHIEELQLSAKALNAQAQEGAEDAEASEAEEKRREAKEKGNQAMDFFVENCLTSWNLEDEEGVPRLLTGEALRKEPTWFGLLVMNTYTAAVRKLSEVDAPLDATSPNGTPSEGPPDPTVVPSSAPESSPTPA